jgi:hypothetical protein
MKKVMLLGWIGVLVTGAAMVVAPQRAGARAVPDEPAWGGALPPCFADPGPGGGEPLRAGTGRHAAVRPAGLRGDRAAWGRKGPGLGAGVARVQRGDALIARVDRAARP